MKTNILFLSFIILFMASACDELFQKKNSAKKSSGDQVEAKIVKEYFENGRLKSEISVMGKERHGITKNYSKFGYLLSEVNYINNKKNGLTVNYYASGKIHSKINFKDGIKDDESLWYYENGKVYRINPFVDGELTGIQKYYFENGKLMAEIPYKNGNTGVGTKEYSKTGTLIDKYPEIRFEEINRIFLENKFTLKIKLSNNSYRVTFYIGALDEGKYMTDKMDEIQTKSGVAILEYEVPPGFVKMEKLSIVAKYRTDYDFPYILQKTYNLALQH